MTASLASGPGVTDWLTAIGTVGTFIVALGAAAVALGQLREARTLREAQAQPFVVVDVEPSIVTRKILNLVIRNVGQTLARNVTIQFDPPLRSTVDSTGYPVANFAALQRGIPALPPGREYQIMLDSTIERFHSELPDSYAVTVRFSDRNGKQMDDLKYDVDLAMYRGAPYVQEATINDMVNEMKNVVKELASLRSAFER